MKIPKQQYTLEFKQLAVKRIQAGEAYELVANELGMSSQTLRYWVSDLPPINHLQSVRIKLRVSVIRD